MNSYQGARNSAGSLRLTSLLMVVFLCSGLISCVAHARAPADLGHKAITEGAIYSGEASWYGHPFHGRRTANGEVYDMNGISAAHRTLPFGTRLEVTNLNNMKTVQVTVNDRGPFVGDRILDLSRGAAKRVAMVNTGVAPVEIRVLFLPGQPEFRLQFGAFQNPEFALDLLRKVESLAPDAQIYTEGPWHRVQVRGIEQARHARKLAKHLKTKGFDIVVLEGAR